MSALASSGNAVAQAYDRVVPGPDIRLSQDFALHHRLRRLETPTSRLHAIARVGAADLVPAVEAAIADSLEPGVAR